MTRAERQERSRGEILSAAAALFARHGFHGLTMRQLARATDQSLANLYNYFASKEDLLFEVQSRAFLSLIASAHEAVDAEESPDGRLYAFVYNHVRYVAAHPDVLRVLVQEAGALPPAPRRAVRELKERYFELGRETLRGVLAGDGRTLGEAELERSAYGVFGMLNWVYGWYDSGRHGNVEDVARSIHALACGGLVARHPRRREQLQTERRVASADVASLLRQTGKGAPA